MSSLDQKQVKRSLEDVGNDGDTIHKSLSELMDALTDEEQDVLLSELTEEEIRHLSVLETVGDDITKEFTTHFRRLKTSKNRKGRKELIKVANAISAVFESESMSTMDKIRGKLPG